MATKWTEKGSYKEAQRNLLPITRHQVIPTAVQSATDSGNSGDKQIYLASLDSPHTTRIYIGNLGQSFLSHSQGRADTSDVAAEFAKTGGDFGFSHAILRERLDIDLKGVVRPNRNSVNRKGQRSL